MSLAVHGAMGCSQKSFKPVGRFHQLLFGFLAKGHMPQVSRQSRLSANDKDDNKLYRELCSDLVAFTLQRTKTPENFSYETVNEGFATIHRLKWVA